MAKVKICIQGLQNNVDIRTKIKAILVLERPHMSILGSACVVAGIFLASLGNIDLILLLKMTFLFWVLNTVAHPINDYFDREADKTGRPNTPIPRGELSLNEVKIIIILNYIFAIACIAILPPNWESRTFAIFGLILTIVYSASPFRLVGRGILGNFALSGAGIFPLWSGWTAVNGFRFDPIILLVTLVYLFFAVGLKLIIDTPDIAGDKRAGRKTVPIQIGPKKSFKLALNLIIFAMILFFSAFFLRILNIFYIILGVISTIVIYFALTNFKKDFGIESKRKYSEMLMIPFFILTIGFVIGSIPFNTSITLVPMPEISFSLILEGTALAMMASLAVLYFGMKDET